MWQELADTLYLFYLKKKLFQYSHFPIHTQGPFIYFLFLYFILRTCTLDLLIACVGISVHYAEWWKDLVQIWALPLAGFVT